MFDLVTFDGTVDHLPCEGYVVYEFACNATIGSSARNAPQGVEIVHCKCGLEIESNDRGNIVCCALNILTGWICAHYECSYYYLLLLPAMMP